MAKLTDSEYEHFTDILATADFGAATDWDGGSGRDHHSVRKENGQMDL